MTSRYGSGSPHVVHDLKTPLSAIATAVHLVQRRLVPESVKATATMN